MLQVVSTIMSGILFARFSTVHYVTHNFSCLFMTSSLFQKVLKNPIFFFLFDNSEVPSGIRTQLNAKQLDPLMRSRAFRNIYIFLILLQLEFLEVSEYSFQCDSVKRKEGIVKKRTGDDHSHGWVKRLLRNLRYLICNACG